MRWSSGHYQISIPMCKHDFFWKIRYNIQFQQVVHKLGESEINYIKIFQHSKAFAVSVEKSCSEYQLMHTFWGFSSKGGLFSSDIQPSSIIENRGYIFWSRILIFICLANWLLELGYLKKIHRKIKFCSTKIHSLWRLSSNWKMF